MIEIEIEIETEDRSFLYFYPNMVSTNLSILSKRGQVQGAKCFCSRTTLSQSARRAQKLNKIRESELY